MATAIAESETAQHRWQLRLPERLPNLKGKWLTLYTIVWAVVLPLAISMAGIGTYIGLTTPTMWSPYGFSTSEDAHGVHVDVVGAPSVRSAGLNPGDYVLEVDGWKVPRTAGRAAARARVIKPEGSLTNFAFKRPTGEVYRLRLLRSVRMEDEAFRAAGMNRHWVRVASAVSISLLPLLFVAASVLLFLRCRLEAVPAMLAMSFLCFAAIMNSADLIGLNFWVVGVINLLAIIFLFGALFAFPSGRFEPRWTAIPFVLSPGFFIFLLFPDAAAEALGIGAIFFLLVLAALLIRYRRLPTGPERQQLRWAFFGLSVGAAAQIIGLMIQIATISWQGQDPRWSIWSYWIGYFGALSFSAMTVGLLVSILRYRLYDADAVIGRSAAYGVLTLGFVVLFAGSQKVIELIGQEYLGQNIGGLAGGIGAALAAVAIAPMHNRAQRWAERNFQKGLYRLRHGLPALVGDLRETSGVEQIAGATLDSLVDGVRTRRAALIAEGTLIDARDIAASEVERWLGGWSPPAHDGVDCDASDEIFPVRVPLEAEGHGRVGWLLLGPRPDGSLFGKAEFDAIEEIAEPVARAVEVALRRSEREAQLEARFAAIEARLTALVKKLGSKAPRSAPA